MTDEEVKELPCKRKCCFFVPMVDNPNCNSCHLNKKKSNHIDIYKVKQN